MLFDFLNFTKNKGEIITYFLKALGFPEILGPEWGLRNRIRSGGKELPELLKTEAHLSHS